MFRKPPHSFTVIALVTGLFLTIGMVTFMQSDEVALAANAEAKEAKRPPGWHKETHSNDVDPNYKVVFPQNAVNQITITIDAKNWTAMQADMTKLFGKPGEGRRGQGGPGFGMPGQNVQPAVRPTAVVSPTATTSQVANKQSTSPLATPTSTAIAQGDGPGFGGPGFGGGDFTSENPIWVTATIQFEGDTWTNVGVRYKGNSSLRSSWNNGSLKLPFKLDFDEFEDQYPEIDNQRFYGFKQLSLANNFGDATGMRDTLTSDLLKEAGLVAAETAPYEVVIDYGKGSMSLGLYTLIEVVDDTVIGQYFDDDGGNIYEGDGRGVSLAEGTYDQIETSFQKENNEDAADWGDIEALYKLLHSEDRTSNPAVWRKQLETIFDVDSFLEWLAISAVIQHWDTYGAMTHNFYLYDDPATNRLTWISWDHNLVLGAIGGWGRPGGGAAPGGRMGGRANVTLDKAEVGDNWPLIRYLLDDPLYYARYLNYIKETSSTLFVPSKLDKKYQAMAAVIAPYATKEMGKEPFETAVQALLDRIDERAKTVETFLDEQKMK